MLFSIFNIILGVFIVYNKMYLEWKCKCAARKIQAFKFFGFDDYFNKFLRFDLFISYMSIIFTGVCMKSKH